MVELKKVELDEIELYLEILKKDHPDEINNATYSEIANLIEKNFGVVCLWTDISLLHEPTIEQDVIALEVYYKEVLGIY